MTRQIDASATIDAYIDSLESPFREAISDLRALILRAAPEADEIITYNMPGIALHGPLIAYSAFKSHCSIFPMGDAVLKDMAEETAPWRSSPGTIQFKPGDPPPADLITRMVQARVVENLAKFERRRSSGSGHA